MHSMEDFKEEQIKQHAIIDAQFDNVFTWRKEMVLPSFEKLEKKIEKINEELKLIDRKLFIVIILNILLLVFVAGKIAPELLKALVAAL